MTTTLSSQQRSHLQLELTFVHLGSMSHQNNALSCTYITHQYICATYCVKQYAFKYTICSCWQTCKVKGRISKSRGRKINMFVSTNKYAWNHWTGTSLNNKRKMLKGAARYKGVLVHVEGDDSADWISSVSTCWLQSSMSSMSMRHEQGLTPFPSNQCWKMAWQHDLGSPRCLFSMVSSCAPLGSKSMRIPSSRQQGASLLMILSLPPPANFSTNNLARVGVASG